MDLVGIHQDDQQMLFRILAAILHLGNVEILEYGEDECTVEVIMSEYTGLEITASQWSMDNVRPELELVWLNPCQSFCAS